MKNLIFIGIAILVTFVNSISEIKAECGLNTPIISNVECLENAVYQFDVNFTISDPALDSFDIYINDFFYKRYSIFDLPVKIVQNRFSGKKFDKLKINDPDRENCYVIKEIENPCTCSIFNTKYAIKKCTDTTFYISLFFNNFETSDSFDVGMIGKYFGTFAYKNLPVTVGPFKNKDTIYTLNIVDRQDFFCFTETKIKAGKCPDCQIAGINLNGYECDEANKVFLKLSFNHTNVKSNEYIVKTNFSDAKAFEYKNKIIVDSVTFREEFVLGPINISCEDSLFVTISDFENQTCTASAIFEKICCNEECVIGDIYIKELVCTSDSTYAFYLKFTYENNSTKVFSVNVDDQYHGMFNVDQLPIKISGIKLDGSKNDFIKICMDEGECCKGKEYAVPVCEFVDCKIENVVWTPIYDTIAGKFWIKIDFAHENNSESFNIKGNGKYYGSFNYESLPIILGSYKCSDSLEIEYIISDAKYELCKAIIEPGLIKCPTSANYEINADDNWKIFNVTGENILEILSDNEITKNGNIEIYNLVGLKIFSSKINDGLNEFSVRIPEKNEGLFIVIFNNSDKVYTKKIFVK